jgi:glycosyltransferase involved in cell wall biosynthesis
VAEVYAGVHSLLICHSVWRRKANARSFRFVSFFPTHMTPPGPSLRLTVAIPTYNRADYLRQTLEGVVKQVYPRNQYEVIVVDNNSRDRTHEVTSEFAERYSNVRYVLETQQGLDHGRNRGIAEARGEIIVFADDDILVETDWLTQLTAPFATDGAAKIGAVGGEVIPVFPHGLPPWVAEWHAPLAFRSTLGPLPAKHSPMGANLAFPRWVFQQHGLFSTALDRKGGSLFSGGETEMLRRLRAAGLEVWFAPAAKVRHQLPANRTTFRYAARHAFDSARSRVVDRGASSVGYLTSRFFANLAKVLGFVLLFVVNGAILRTGEAKKALVRAWRSCGYLYQIPRTLFGKI